MERKYKIIIGIVVLVLVFSVGLFNQKNETNNEGIVNETESQTPQLEIIDEHLSINNSLEDVYFCGKTYKTKQVIFDGVDFVKRIADLVNSKEINTYYHSADLAKEICDKAENFDDLSVIDVGIEAGVKSGVPYDKTIFYHISFLQKTYRVNTSDDSIYLFEYYDGPTGPIGELKK